MRKCPNCLDKTMHDHETFLECLSCGLLMLPDGFITYDPKEKGKPIVGEPR